MNNLPLCPTEISSENNRKLSRNDVISRKNKTIKKRRQQKSKEEQRQNYEINNLVKNMHGDDESDGESELGDYSPPPYPSVQQKPQQSNEKQIYSSNYEPENSESGEDEALSPEGFRSLEPSNPETMYNQYVPYYTNTANQQSLDGPKDKLLEKLNYMIHLLEEQKEEKTGHVTEELILYSFLGVFVIFIVDSFARVGKYVR